MGCKTRLLFGRTVGLELVEEACAGVDFSGELIEATLEFTRFYAAVGYGGGRGGSFCIFVGPTCVFLVHFFTDFVHPFAYAFVEFVNAR